MTLRRLSLALAAFALASGPLPHSHTAGADEGWGDVHFPISCSPGVQRIFGRAVAMLHSFSFGEAAKTFTAVAEADPECAMAYWGIAVTKMGSLYGGRVRPQALVDGRALVERAKALKPRTERERDYLAAAAAFYAEADARTRLRAYVEALDRLRRKYPDDLEAAVFHAYALTALAPPDDLTYAYQREGARLLEELLARRPDHPGIVHYLIHAYDYAPLAARGLEAARRYPALAPRAPHALQFPAHIFVHLGLWRESIEANRAGMAVEDHFFKFHAMDFLVYSYLQTAQDAEAKRVIDEAEATGAIRAEQPITAYALAAMPARYAVERRAWSEAAGLALPRPDFPWWRFPQAEAALVFAHALGAARTGDVDAASRDLDKLERLRGALIAGGQEGTFQAYWVGQIEIDRQKVEAWVLFWQGRREEALSTLRAAAEREDATERDPIVPGPIVSARELLGDMLLDLSEPSQALQTFEAALRAEPGRFWNLYGAARSAELAGDLSTSKAYYVRLVTQAGDTPDSRPGLGQAHAFLAAHAPDL